MRTCTIYSPNVTTNGVIMDIPNGTQNVILYCICRRNNVAVGPATWFINGTTVTRTTASENNPYTRDNVPSPLIIPSFTATYAGTYGCQNNFFASRVTIDLILSGIVCYIRIYEYILFCIYYLNSYVITTISQSVRSSYS